jgi:hypothetical protein
MPWPFVPAVLVPVGRGFDKYGSLPHLNEYDFVDRGSSTLVRIQVPACCFSTTPLLQDPPHTPEC